MNVARAWRMQLSRVRQFWWRLAIPPYLQAFGLEIGREARFFGMPIVNQEEGSAIRIGPRSVLCSDSRYTALGVNHPVVLRTLRHGAEIEIGQDTGISGGAICAAVSVRIGARCLLGANVVVTDTDFHAVAPENRRWNNDPEAVAAAPVVIEDDVFVGSNAMILKGVTIGRDSVVGAGAIVTRDVPAGSVVVGSAAMPRGTVYRREALRSDEGNP